MVAPGSMGTYKPKPPSTAMYGGMVAIFVLFSLGAGYKVATLSTGAWTQFSWHPFLMTSGMVGMMGISAITKKRGGYLNTKMHGILSWVGLCMALGGLYSVYQYKTDMGQEHFTSAHSIAGAGLLGSCVGAGMVGGIFLHPDFGVDKTNKQIRLIHKMFSRIILILSWVTAFLGLVQLTEEPMTLVAYGVPLMALIPFTLM
mmetsp:Transcript_23805/g.33290  ORF Transcript_23805/g.33290 Transcript_23805/m.33290 type:complete len:201 (-) Transcript_23805:443-1045(-)